VSVLLANQRHWRAWRRTFAMRPLTAVECQAADGDLHHYHVTGPEADIEAMLALCPVVQAVEYRILIVSNRGAGQSRTAQLRQAKTRRRAAWRKAGNAAAGQGFLRLPKRR
jgi:hypothetical protein